MPLDCHLSAAAGNVDNCGLNHHQQEHLMFSFKARRNLLIVLVDESLRSLVNIVGLDLFSVGAA